LRSANQHLLAVPRSRLKTKGDQAFALVVPQLWNNLSISKKLTQYIFLKKLLKTHLFSLAFM
ncbi:hypothetical protein LDENG_00032360, partial [Lucifuga dentata]